MKKVAVILAGCGVQDGSEIHEAVCTLLALSSRGIEYSCLAPEGQQTRVMDHAVASATDETRTMLAESARIARGEIQPISSASPDDFSAVIIPGGFGAALNLSNFATAGAEMEIEPSLNKFLVGTLDAEKPIGALCIAPPILARLMQQRGVTGARLTIGNDSGTAAAIEAMGQAHVTATARQAVVDPAHKLVTCPAYMLAGSIAELNEGIDKAVEELLKLALGDEA